MSFLEEWIKWSPIKEHQSLLDNRLSVYSAYKTTYDLFSESAELSFLSDNDLFVI